MLEQSKIAVVHDWLVAYAGGERVLQQILATFPGADLYSLVDFVPEEQRAFLANKKVCTSFIQRLPFAAKKYTHYLPLMPLAIEQFDLQKYDIVISSCHAVAKGVLTGPDQLHISYVHSPIRYAWDLQHQYLQEASLTTGLKSWLARFMLHKIRMWDLRTANGVDKFVANSAFIARRIQKVYRRDAQIIYPPVDIDRFAYHPDKEDFYLAASRLVPYKRMPLIAQAFAETPQRKLVIIGDGPDLAKIQAMQAPNIRLLGYQSQEVMVNHMQRAKAVVCAAIEDFGIATVEAQACGTPVIAYAAGGALEIIRGLDQDAPTGVFFNSQDVASIRRAIDRFERQYAIHPSACRENALRFCIDEFRQRFTTCVEQEWARFQRQ